MKSTIANELVADAARAVQFWEEHPDIKLKKSTCAGLRRGHEQFEAVAKEVMAQENLLRVKLLERDALAAEVKDGVTRLRLAVRGIYGRDSSEYEQLGGTKLSDRKRPVRRSAVTTPALAVANGNGGGNTNGNGTGNS